MMTISDRLRHARAVLQKRQAFAALLYGGVAAVVILLFASATNLIFPLQERHAFLLILAISLTTLACLGFSFYRIFLKPMRFTELAARIEQLQPKWMDALICAVEQEQRPEEKLRILERSVVARMREETKETDFTPLLLTPSLNKRPLTLVGGVLGLLLLLLFATPFFRKGVYYFSDIPQAETSGLKIEPAGSEAPIGSDVTIAAEVLRWDNNAEIEYIDSTGRHRHPMNRGANGHFFTFYSLAGDARFRIHTPSLRSQWYHVSSYIPPAILSARILVEPPAYTRMETEARERLGNIQVVEGSRIAWELVLPEGVTARMLSDAGNRDFTERDGGHHLEIIAEESFTYRLIVTDGDGRNATTGEIDLNVLPDNPPTVDITRPGRDIAAAPDARVDIQALAADDFGLAGTILRISVSGDRQRQFLLFQPDEGVEPVRERTLNTALNLADFNLQDGDVITYFIEAIDNREPDARAGRSEIFFIEIREETEPNQMEGIPTKVENIDVQALIVEMKRLIRLSWEGLASTAEDREQLAHEITNDLQQVRLETLRKRQELIEQAGEGAAALAALFDRAAERMHEAAYAAFEGGLNRSIPDQERALATLVTIQNELLRNQTQSSEPGESSSESRTERQRQSPEETIERMQELLREARRLADDQAAQNSATARLAGASISGEQRDELERRQQEMETRASELQRAARSAMPPAGQQLGIAARQMESARGEIGRQDLDAATRQGERARASLMAAADMLQGVLEQATENQVSRLAQMAEAIAREQGEAAAGSRQLAGEPSPSAEQAGAARARQRQLQRELQGLQSAIGDAAGRLREEQPDISRELGDMNRELRESGVDGRMTRAANALLYRRFEQAAGTQEALAGELEELAQNLQDAAERMPQISRQQLEELLDRVQRARQEVSEMAGQAPGEIAPRLNEMSERLGQGLSDAGRALRDQILHEIGGAIANSNRDQTAPNIFQMDQMLRAAARALEQRLFALEIDRRSRLQRQSAIPPEQYRELVEEYFRNLSEMP